MALPSPQIPEDMAPRSHQLGERWKDQKGQMIIGESLTAAFDEEENDVRGTLVFKPPVEILPKTRRTEEMQRRKLEMLKKKKEDAEKLLKEKDRLQLFRSSAAARRFWCLQEQKEKEKRQQEMQVKKEKQQLELQKKAK
eukprot:Skav236127  [mRNA]  locus=scaffold900:251477:253782:- [translate_table: standard]